MSNYTNSPLVSYTKLSPNHSGERTHVIDTITIHTMAGDLSIQTCGALFADPNRQASSNYGIDSNGNIAMYVEEKNRSWCSSNKANDQRAVTIEVASINTTDFRPSDKAYNSLIILVADVCRRNDIPKLLWKADKSLIGKVDQQNMTVHRWFSAKACPGEWLYAHMGEIANAVNKILSTTEQTGVTDPEYTEGNSTDVKTSIEVKMWNALDKIGLNDYAKAGVIGNIFAESGLVANNLQNSFEGKFGYTDNEYTEAVDSGKYVNFPRDGAGYGLAQWTYWSRKEGLYNYAKSTGKSIGDEDMQIEYLCKELQESYGKLLTLLSKATLVQEASDLVLIKFENPGGYGDKMPQSYRTTRAKYAQEYYNKYASGESNVNKFPYTVMITTNALNIRKGPGTNYAKADCIRDHGIYTIVEESTGTGANLWGKLKSGAGWIAIDNRWNSKV